MHLKIFIAGDHTSHVLRQSLIECCHEMGIQAEDLGISTSSQEDYIDITKKLATSLNEDEKGVLICGSGLGVTIAANRYPSIRAAMCRTSEDARLARRQNNANVLCMGSKFTTVYEAKMIFNAFMNTSFKHENHAKSMEKLHITVA